ncbi:hypothetical protein LCGC14_1558020 [marine sediment metagenome]|uniref:Uncharacterized protein n=1 Tax=marine sediment metagenome TaxID=412755 RepID=A0A0F9L4Q1_9ZZZZ
MAIDSDKVYEKLDSIDSKVDKLLIWKAAHVTAHESIERDVSDNRAALFENPGVISNMSYLLNCKKTLTRWQEFWMNVLRYLIVAAVVAVVIWLLKGVPL